MHRRTAGPVEPVAIEEEAELATSRRDRRERLKLGDVVVVMLGVEPGRVCDLLQPVNWARELPVDELQQFLTGIFDGVDGPRRRAVADRLKVAK